MTFGLGLVAGFLSNITLILKGYKKRRRMFKADIYITLKKTVADPQGLTIKHALESLNYKEVQEVRIGKIISVKLNIKDKKEAEKRLDEMCRKLLASPIIEDYSFNIKQC